MIDGEPIPAGRSPIRKLPFVLFLLWVASASLASAALSAQSEGEQMKTAATPIRVERLPGNPIVRPGEPPSIGTNVQGPSLIRVPDWVPDPLGQYYLYFADHKGSYIRMAYADSATGPFTVYEPGTLKLEESFFLTEPATIPEKAQAQIDLGGFAKGPVKGVPAPLDSATKPHIASPDVHVRDDLKQIVMYYHGLSGFRMQLTRVATSLDGLTFEARPKMLARPYLRAFEQGGEWFAMGMPGVFYRSADGILSFEKGPTLFPNTMRHAALLKREDVLYVFWTRVGDKPEHILLSTIELSDDWTTWKASDARSVLRPKMDWEGADQPLVASVRDAINVRVNQLRDPAIFEEDGRTYLLYAVAGESGIAIAELYFSGD